MNAEFFLKEKGIFNLDTKKRYNEVIQWMDEYAEAKAEEAVTLDDVKIQYYEDKIEMLIRTSAEKEIDAWNAAIDAAAEGAEICPNCEGHGYTVEIEAVCCGKGNGEGGCCNYPDPQQVQIECKCDNGHIRNDDVKQSILNLKK